jgi:Zn-dependent peptidase ImmA (M78 family)
MSTAAEIQWIDREEIEDKASQLLKKNGVAPTPPIDPVALAVSENIRVKLATFRDESVVGMISRQGGTFVIYVNDNDHITRKRFTIAHELGHYCLGHLDNRENYVDKDSYLFRQGFLSEERRGSKDHWPEIQANIFAAALLMPQELVQEHCGRHPSLKSMARVFQVSQQAMQYRLDALDLWP